MTKLNYNGKNKKLTVNEGDSWPGGLELAIFLIVLTFYKVYQIQQSKILKELFHM